MFSHSLRSTVFLFIFLPIVSSTSFDLSTLTLSSLKLIGDAHLINGSVQLTRDLPVPTSGAGRAIFSQPIQLRNPSTRAIASFSTFFSFAITNLNPSSIGGGLAFLLSSDSDTSGVPGGCLGLCSSAGYVAVEFDTRMDVEYGDINGNHVGLDLNSVVSLQSYDLTAIDIDLKSGAVVNAWIEYDSSVKKVSISTSYSDAKPKSPILSIPIDLEKYLNDSMYVGFSGSTQGSTETHTIEYWNFSSSFTQSLAPSQPPLAINDEVKPSSCRARLCNQGAVAGVATASAVFIIFSGLAIWVFSRNLIPARKPNSSYDVIKLPKEYTFNEMKRATKKFSESRIIGQGASGIVYRASLPETGEAVAVKRCKCNNIDSKSEFLSELALIATLRHRNLLTLKGWCYERDEVLLIYDLMANGSLDKALHEETTPLQWPQRVNILIGVASAMSYLHQECETQIIHRDIKSSNIMLDEQLNPKLGDFGLARQFAHDTASEASAPAGTMGYLAPEYVITGRATRESDVFSYGAVALEVASGRRPIERERVEREGNRCLVESVWRMYGEGRVLSAADERLGGDFSEREMKRVLMVGLLCSHPDPVVRPSMRSVVQMLLGEMEVPPVPLSRPTISFSVVDLLSNLGDSSSDGNGLAGLSSSSSVSGGVRRDDIV